MKKIAIVLTYFERPFQAIRTLKSIAKTEYPDYHIILVDDGSREPFFYIQDKLTIVRLEDKKWTSGIVALNRGLEEAFFNMKQRPNIVIIQNTEAYHWGDVISYASQIKEGEYISFGCFSLNKNSTFTELRKDFIERLLLCQRGASFDGDCAWYNHPVYRPVAYNFCCAINADDIIRLNGFDERFAEGWCYEDDYFIWAVRQLGLSIEITTPPDPIVLHQWHYDKEIRPEEKLIRNKLVERNKNLYQQLTSSNNTDFRAVHKFTKDLS